MTVKIQDAIGEDAMVALGAALAKVCAAGGVVYLQGDLGAGKTILSRGIIRALGHQGAVKSPTYTLVEPYELPAVTIYHFDLYRLADPEELEYMGIREYFGPRNLCLVEWADRGAGEIPDPDVKLSINHHGEGRRITIEACTHHGKTMLEALEL